MLPRVKRIVPLLLIPLLLLLSSCGLSDTYTDITPEEAHELCEAYKADVEWGYYTREYAPNDLEAYARILAENPDSICLCEFEIVSTGDVTKRIDSGPINTVSFVCDLTIRIRSVFAGDSLLFERKEIVVPVMQLSGDFEHLVGKRYVSFISRNSLGTYFLCPNPMCLIVEGDTLVSPRGCTFEEAEDGYGFECRNYTGQKLGYYVKLVNDAIKEYEAE